MIAFSSFDHRDLRERVDSHGRARCLRLRQVLWDDVLNGLDAGSTISCQPGGRDHIVDTHGCGGFGSRMRRWKEQTDVGYRWRRGRRQWPSRADCTASITFRQVASGTRIRTAPMASKFFRRRGGGSRCGPSGAAPTVID